MDKYNVFPYQNANPLFYPQLKAWAKENRQFPTEAEKRLREYVRANQLGYKFLFQYIIGEYIVDFLCPAAKLIIEVDGVYHSEPEQFYKDELRTMWLQNMGYTVIRFTNELVMDEIDNVLEVIEENLN